MSELRQIEHESEKQRFCCRIGDDVAVLEYQFPDSQTQPMVIDFSRTYVPAELRGQGVAEALVRAGLAWAKQQQFTIEASCWYVQKFLT